MNKYSNDQSFNSIELVNLDPMLSEFKYHFYLKSCHIPRQYKIQEIYQNIYKGFNLPLLTSSSIYIVQIIKVNQEI